MVGSNIWGVAPPKALGSGIVLFFPRASERRSSNSGGLSNIFSSSHLLIFTSSHLHILTSSHLLIFTSSHSHLPSCSLALLLSPSFYFSLEGAGQCQRHETQPFRTKWGWIAKNSSKITISGFQSQPFRTKWGSIAKNWSKIAICRASGEPFRARN